MPNREENQVEVRRKAVSEAFHSLHQPLTGLHCGLELALLRNASEAEYRKRVEDALANAGAVLKLTRALRELVEANDRGEEFGTVSLDAVMAQVQLQINGFGEASQVRVQFETIEAFPLLADPNKLARCLTGTLDYLISGIQPGGEIKVSGSVAKTSVRLRFSIRGDMREHLKSAEAQAREIRRDAAFGYALTIGGTVKQTPDEVEFQLPIQKAHTSLPAARSRTIGASASRKS